MMVCWIHTFEIFQSLKQIFVIKEYERQGIDCFFRHKKSAAFLLGTFRVFPMLKEMSQLSTATYMNCPLIIYFYNSLKFDEIRANSTGFNIR